jgi:hypothetical protein
MRARLQNAAAWTIGPTVWMSSIAMMIHGLWTGEWYGYVLALIIGIGVGIILVQKYRIGDHHTA